MSKIKKADLLQLLQEQADMVVELVGMVEKNKQSIIKLENEREKPQLKQLDQSVFNGLDEKWRWAAIDDDGSAYAFIRKPEIDEHEVCFIVGDVAGCKRISEAYDTSNWQNSLIERDITKELTGSDLAMAMLERGDRYVMCFVSGMSDAKADSIPKAITSFNSLTRQFRANHDIWRYAVPINNQGKPLTAAEVGL